MDEEQDLVNKEDLLFELKVVQMVRQVFPNVERIYDADKHTALPFSLMKLKQDILFCNSLLVCPMEELGVYAPLTQSQINNYELLSNKPAWRLAWIQQYTQAIMEYNALPRVKWVDPTFCLFKQRHT